MHLYIAHICYNLCKITNFDAVALNKTHRICKYKKNIVPLRTFYAVLAEKTYKY